MKSVRLSWVDAKAEKEFWPLLTQIVQKGGLYLFLYRRDKVRKLIPRFKWLEVA